MVMLPVPTKDVCQSELRTLAGVSGGGFRLVGPVLRDDDIVLRGDFRQMRLREGLILHATDTCEMHDLRTEVVQRAGMTFSMFLRGSVQAWIGERSFVMGAAGPRDRRPIEAVAIVRAEADTFARQSVRGTRVRKVNVTVTPEWLEDSGLDAVDDHARVVRFSREHLASLRWRPSPRLITIADQILRPPTFSPLLQNLYFESRALEFAAEALSAIARSDASDPEPALRPKDHLRLNAICDFLDASLDRPLTLQAIARDAGMSVNTLQRLFRAAHGATVFEYVRIRKLDRAREALERDGVPVAQAAYIAGYASAANFATAFKRRFGVSPKNCRSHT